MCIRYVRPHCKNFYNIRQLPLEGLHSKRKVPKKNDHCSVGPTKQSEMPRLRVHPSYFARTSTTPTPVDARRIAACPHLAVVKTVEKIAPVIALVYTWVLKRSILPQYYGLRSRRFGRLLFVSYVFVFFYTKLCRCAPLLCTTVEKPPIHLQSAPPHDPTVCAVYHCSTAGRLDNSSRYYTACRFSSGLQNPKPPHERVLQLACYVCRSGRRRMC